jgi:hypothetical protein
MKSLMISALTRSSYLPEGSHFLNSYISCKNKHFLLLTVGPGHRSEGHPQGHRKQVA